MSNYYKDKLLNKLQLLFDNKVEINGDIKKIVDEISDDITGDGDYEIIWKSQRPVSLKKLNDVKINKAGVNYIITGDSNTRLLFWAQIINFNISEFRDEKLNLIFNER
jgi:hypothetical protein